MCTRVEGCVYEDFRRVSYQYSEHVVVRVEPVRYERKPTETISVPDRGTVFDDDDELALERKKMREFVSSACDAQSRMRR